MESPADANISRSPKQNEKMDVDLSSSSSKYDRNGVRLYDYQVEAVERILSQFGTCLCFATGNGKSLVAVAATQRLLGTYAMLKIFVVAPLSLLHNFKLALEKYGVDPNHPAYIYHTYQAFCNAYQKNPLLCDGHVVILDEVHALCTNIYATMSKNPNLSYLPFEERQRILKSLRLAAHTVCNPLEHVFRETGFDITPYAPRPLLTLLATSRALKVICLTATPFMNGPYDVANLVSILRQDGVYPEVMFKKWCANQDYFQSLVRGLFLFQDVKKNDPDFPRVIKNKVDLPMSPEYYEAYHNIEMELNMTRFMDLRNPWVFLNGLRRATNALEDAVKPKYALEIILRNEPTIIFSVFKSQGIRTVAKYLDELKWEYGEITGDVKPNVRRQLVKKFNDNQLKTILLTAAGGEGLDFIGVRHIVCLECEWNYAQIQQVIGRGPRRHSHSHLPPEERLVNVHLLCLTKPPNSQLLQHDHIHESADQMLRRMAKQKLKDIAPIKRLLRSA